MGLMMMLDEVLSGADANAKDAKDANHKPETPPTLARLAGLALASSPKPETGRPNLTLAYSRPSQQEAGLYADRLQAFQGKGIPTHEAQALANQLAKRDRQLDDRRSCAECQSFYAGRCKRGLYPIGESTIQTLHRCKGFSL